MKSPLLIVVLLVSAFLSKTMAQKSPYVDSLNQAIRTEKGAKLFDAYFHLTDVYRMNDRFEVALQTANNYMNLAKKEKNTLEMVKAYALLTHIFTNEEDFKKAQLLQDSAIMLANESKDAIVTAYANYAKMVFYYSVSNNEMLTKLYRRRFCL